MLAYEIYFTMKMKQIMVASIINISALLMDDSLSFLRKHPFQLDHRQRYVGSFIFMINQISL